MCNKHQCHIVPEHILAALAKRGSKNCKKTLNDTRRILEKRNTLLNGLLQQKLATGEGDRKIYDCENKFEQRVTLSISEGDALTDDATANSAYDTSGFVRAYFKDTFNLNSVNGEGMDLVSNVHYGENYNNAFWDGDEMTYGDGDQVDFKDFASAIDVVAHELTHGITQFMANLEYEGQPGALNEHFSDVFGTIIKQKYLDQSLEEADWLIGNTIVTETFPGVALRSMKAPGTANDFDTQPDHMDWYYAGPEDHQGVHINSGIPNKAFYLCCLEIGIDNCALLWFETLKFLWRTANFNDMLEVLLTTAELLISQNKLPKAATMAIETSFTAVGLPQKALI
ncbi:Bacillolysin [Cellulophaga algicola DSM 14237]|uniref:Neutral metalloproteinase n=1 Tax=Cellulophaga algicola (strain DSM 14237 / IC166 / ACAM 630) TaxID=688270 RepID=E6XD39_CELAD|nr:MULTISPECIES: M4 family metallopeptidase [Cellulophaga]ADV51226.1 Bacillolysin [Cellulophaga algicola DSM 14237]